MSVQQRDVGSSAPMTIEELIAAARNGSTRAAGRLLSLVESPRRDEVLAALGRPTPPASSASPARRARASRRRSPCSSRAYRERGMRVAVLAVDPSSPYSGGALLGDRIRMAAHINDPDVLIRSVATRGHLGGLAAAVPAAIRLLAALSLRRRPDRDGRASGSPRSRSPRSPTRPSSSSIPVRATRFRRPRRACSRSPTSSRSTRPIARAPTRRCATCAPRPTRPILKIVAAQNEGIAELVEAIDAHHRADSPERRAARARAQILSLAQSALRDAARARRAGGRGRRGRAGRLHGDDSRCSTTPSGRCEPMRMSFPLSRNDVVRFRERILRRFRTARSLDAEGDRPRQSPRGRRRIRS